MIRKLKMTCEQAQNFLLDSQSHTELEAHLATCSQCRNDARLLARIRMLPNPSPLPAALHNRVLMQTGLIIRRATEKKGVVVPVGNILLALVALVYVSAVGLWLMKQSAALLPQYFIGLLLMQNLLALFFSPIIFWRFYQSNTQIFSKTNF